MNSVVKSYISVIIPDAFIAFNFWTRDWSNVTKGHLQPGFWCKFSGFVAITSMSAYSCGTVIISFTTYRWVGWAWHLKKMG